MHFSAFYCIHCHRTFIGNAARQAYRRHMIEAHGKQAVYGLRGNIRCVDIEVKKYESSRDTLYIPNFDGLLEIEVANGTDIAVNEETEQ